MPKTLIAEELAQKFHEAYERLAPNFGYKTREASAKPWAEVPENNRKLMEAVVAEVMLPRITKAEAEVKKKDELLVRAMDEDCSVCAKCGEELASEFKDVIKLRLQAWTERAELFEARCVLQQEALNKIANGYDDGVQAVFHSGAESAALAREALVTGVDSHLLKELENLRTEVVRTDHKLDAEKSRTLVLQGALDRATSTLAGMAGGRWAYDARKTDELAQTWLDGMEECRAILRMTKEKKR